MDGALPYSVDNRVPLVYYSLEIHGFWKSHPKFSCKPRQVIIPVKCDTAYNDNFGKFHGLPVINSGMLNFCTYDTLHNMKCDTSLTKALHFLNDFHK